MRIERGIFLAVLLSIVWMPLPFASQRPWASFLAAAIFSLLLLLLLLSNRRLLLERVSVLKLPISLLAVPVILCLYHSVPLFISNTADIEDFVMSVQGGGSPYDSVLYFAKSLLYLQTFILVGCLASNRHRLLAVLVAFLISVGFQAIFGSAMTLSGIEYGFFIHKYAGIGSATGTFINPNHYAAYMIIGFAVCVGLIYALYEKRSPEDRYVYKTPAGIFSVGLKILLGFIVLAVVLSTSRTANVILFCVCFSLWLVVAVIRRQHNARLAVLLSLFIFVDFLIVGLFFGFDNLMSKFFSASIFSDYRFKAFDAALPLLIESPFVGVGPGAFDTEFTKFNMIDPPVRFMYLHNDYLQIAIEYGFVGFVALSSLVLQTALLCFKVLNLRRSWQIRACCFTFLMVFTWLLLHSLVDFSMQITAVVHAVVILLALVWNADLIPNGRKTSA